MKRIRTSRWMSSMLRKMDRFQRVASWPDSPRMRFLLRHSPAHWMRERLWLLARLEPQVQVVHRNLTNRFLISYTAAAPMATRIVHRNSTILLRLQEAESGGVPSRVPSMGYERAEARPAPVSPTALAAPTTRTPVRQSLPRREMSPLPALEGPLVTRLVRRARRIDDIQVDPTARFVRAPAARVQALAEPAYTPPTSPPALAGFPRTQPTSWPAQLAPAAPVNVDQLTSEVLRQLDRRIIASRERMGRI